MYYSVLSVVVFYKIDYLQLLFLKYYLAKKKKKKKKKAFISFNSFLGKFKYSEVLMSTFCKVLSTYASIFQT